MYDIGMVQVTLNLDFSGQLADELHFSFENVLRDLFNRTDEVCSLMSGLRSPYRLR